MKILAQYISVLRDFPQSIRFVNTYFSIKIEVEIDHNVTPIVALGPSDQNLQLFLSTIQRFFC